MNLNKSNIRIKLNTGNLEKMEKKKTFEKITLSFLENVKLTAFYKSVNTENTFVQTFQASRMLPTGIINK